MKKVTLILMMVIGFGTGVFAQIPNINSPELFGGGKEGFGGYFRVLYSQGKYTDMLKFTSSASIKKHGKEKIVNFYKNEFRFGYELGKVKSSTKDGDVTTLNYPDAHIMATKKVIRIPVVIENDSVKVVLPENLKEFLK